jgi:hypothetical protein
MRGRLSIAAVVFVAALIGLTMALPYAREPSAANSLAAMLSLQAIDAGPLTSKHAASIQWSDCSSCHAPHNTGPLGWWKAMREGGDMNAQCRACHAFGARSAAFLTAAGAERTERLPHNYAAFGDRKDAMPSACETCHVEHRGAGADITHMSDAQCNVCHLKKMTAFDADHPAFPDRYPYFERGAIRFNHVSHVYDYFQRADQKAFAPIPDQLCTSCHLPSYAAKAVPPAGYDRMCAACHDRQIKDANLEAFVLPELPDRLRKPDSDKVKAACGRPVGEYETESDLRLTGAAAFMLDQTALPAIGRRPPSAQDAFAKTTFDALFAMAERGGDALGEFVAARAKEWQVKAPVSHLFDGLSLRTARRIACDWLASGEFLGKVNDVASPGTWFASQHTIKYRPSGHADPLVRDWLRLAADLDSSPLPADAPRRQIAASLRRQLLGIGANPNDESTGACAKCHGLVAASTKGEDGALDIGWRFERSVKRPFTNFTHAHHLDLVLSRPIREPRADSTAAAEPQINQRCAFCHVLKREQGDYDAAFHNFERTDPAKFSSNFVGITKAVCENCHRATGFRQDCQTCHRYHFEPQTHPRSVASAGNG